ncbi:hypothetical protein K438DRAFT_1959080 [Mycena galopus ATCC 62051]|nr:hypothetical protein K438DRAFT_1959080 [Mycena galopus ATCC 62051]
MSALRCLGALLLVFLLLFSNSAYCSSCAPSPAPPSSTSRGLRNTLQVVLPAQYLEATSSTTKISSSPPSLARTYLVGVAMNATPPANRGCPPCTARLELGLRAPNVLNVEPYLQDVVLCSRMRPRLRSRISKAALPVYPCSVPLLPQTPQHAHDFAFTSCLTLYIAPSSTPSDPVAVYQSIALHGVTARRRDARQIHLLILRVTPTTLVPQGV